jgi:nitrogen fixation protein NifB
MRHCRQCRADAVGLIGQDQGASFDMAAIETMEVDYQAARHRRTEVREAIEREKGKVRQSRTVEVQLAPIQSTKRGLEPTVIDFPLLIAVATRGGGLINEHFGEAEEFLIYEASSQDVRLVGVRKTQRYCTGPTNCEKGEEVLASAVRALAGCAAVLCAKIGFEPWRALEAAGIVPNAEYVDLPIKQSVNAIYRELLRTGNYHRLGPRMAMASA